MRKGDKNPLSCCVTAVKHKHLNCSVCSNRNHSMKTQRWNRVSFDVSSLCMLVWSYLHGGELGRLCPADRIAFSFFSPLPPLAHDWDLFMFPVVALGKRTHHQKTLTSIFVAPFKNEPTPPPTHTHTHAQAFSWRSSLCLLSPGRYYKQYFTPRGGGGGGMAPHGVIVWVV